ncbi:MAG TPA: anti-sigma factor antagonist [Phycisphaerales bacterium]|nr:anti-sigma factor antagonist [Phycisphaerales bacterium]
MLTDWSDDIVVVELAEDPQLSDELSAIIERVASSETAHVPHVVLNMALIGYIKSSNLAQLLRLRKLVGEVGRELILCSVDDRVWSVMSVTGLDKLFQVAPDPMTALAGIQLGEDSADG